jgi:hypothetical protein
MSVTDTQQFIDFVAEPGDLLGLVILDGKVGDRSMGRNSVGFYLNRERFYADVRHVNGRGDIYVNLNQLTPDLYGRAADRVKFWAKSRFGDSEILRRRALLVDCDPVRVSGINSTD